MRQKIKPPATPKIELMVTATAALFRRYPADPNKAIEYLLNFFTSADLVGIIEELKE